jgi:hypothetical protein
MLKKITFFIILAFAGITQAQAGYDANTLGANKSVPNSLIKKELDDSTAGIILETAYKGFYQIGGKVVKSQFTFKNVKTKKSFPDERWAEVATNIASLADAPVYSTGSRIRPSATAYVAFYDTNIKVDRSKVMRLETSVKGEPNIVAVLVVKRKNTTSAKNPERGIRGGGEPTSNVYLFELAI